MKHLILTLCAAYFCCVLATGAIAQDKAGSTAPPTEQNISTEDAKITSKYDAAKNETTVEFGMLGLADTGKQRILLSVSATYAGQKPKKQPEDIVFILSIASTQGYRYPDAMAMQITADGKKLPQVLMLNLDKRRLDEDYLETIGTRMKYEIFKRLTQANTIELQLHDLTLQFDKTQIAKMRELEELLH